MAAPAVAFELKDVKMQAVSITIEILRSRLKLNRQAGKGFVVHSGITLSNLQELFLLCQLMNADRGGQIGEVEFVAGVQDVAFHKGTSREAGPGIAAQPWRRSTRIFSASALPLVVIIPPSPVVRFLLA